MMSRLTRTTTIPACLLLVGALLALAQGCGQDTEKPPNLVVYLIDTLRADHVGCYGYGRDVTPAIDAFAREAVLFENAIAQSSWTRASVASLFTGLWPPAHGANRRRHALASDAVTIAELLQAAGYRTAAFVTNPNVTADFGFAQGFEDFEYLGGVEVRAETVTDAVVRWLDEHGDDGPFFVYVHTIDPHAPYDPPPRFRRAFAPGVPASTVHQPNLLLPAVRAGRLEVEEPLVAEMLALYDAEIAANDAAFGYLLAALRERGLYRDAVITVLSDHGEEFYEHGNFEHGKALFDESLRVPLILKLAAGEGAMRVPEAAQHVDLLPTVLDLLGIAAPAGLEGRSLRGTIAAWLRGAAAGPAPPVFAYLHLDGAPRASVHRGHFKLMHRLDGGRLVSPRLFDLASDPGETRDLSRERPALAQELAALLRQRLRTAEEHGLVPERAVIDEETRRRLEALGYL
jgi:arylsulfatase A-like enzyme